MTITITCEECGHRHRLERRVTEPGAIYIVCHNCELPLQAMLEDCAVPAAGRDYSVWGNIFNDIPSFTEVPTATSTSS